MIRFECPHCGKHIKVPDEHASRRARCPGCSGLFTIPAATGGRVAAELDVSAPPSAPAPVPPPPAQAIVPSPSPARATVPPPPVRVTVRVPAAAVPSAAPPPAGAAPRRRLLLIAGGVALGAIAGAVCLFVFVFGRPGGGEPQPPREVAEVAGEPQARQPEPPPGNPPSEPPVAPPVEPSPTPGDAPTPPVPQPPRERPRPVPQPPVPPAPEPVVLKRSATGLLTFPDGRYVPADLRVTEREIFAKPCRSDLKGAAWSADWRRFAIGGGMPGKAAVAIHDENGVLKTHEWPSWDEVSFTELSADGERVANVLLRYKQGARARTVDAWALAVDGKIISEGKAYTGLGFSPDCRRFAYAYKDEAAGTASTKAVLVIDDEVQPHTVFLPRPWPVGMAPLRQSLALFSPDSKHVAFAATSAEGAYVVVDGKRQASPKALFLPVWSPDSKHIVYFGGESQDVSKQHLYLDGVAVAVEGKKEESYRIEHDTPLVFSDNGEHVAFVIYDFDERCKCIVVDGKPMKASMALDPASVRFLRDGRVTYRYCRAEEGPYGLYEQAVDGKPVQELWRGPHELDGVRHAYVTKVRDEPPTSRTSRLLEGLCINGVLAACSGAISYVVESPDHQHVAALVGASQYVSGGAGILINTGLLSIDGGNTGYRTQGTCLDLRFVAADRLRCLIVNRGSLRCVELQLSSAGRSITAADVVDPLRPVRAMDFEAARWFAWLKTGPKPFKLEYLGPDSDNAAELRKLNEQFPVVELGALPAAPRTTPSYAKPTFWVGSSETRNQLGYALLADGMFGGFLEKFDSSAAGAYGSHRPTFVMSLGRDYTQDWGCGPETVERLRALAGRLSSADRAEVDRLIQALERKPDAWRKDVPLSQRVTQLDLDALGERLSGELGGTWQRKRILHRSVPMDVLVGDMCAVYPLRWDWDAWQEVYPHTAGRMDSSFDVIGHNAECVVAAISPGPYPGSRDEEYRDRCKKLTDVLSLSPIRYKAYTLLTVDRIKRAADQFVFWLKGNPPEGAKWFDLALSVGEFEVPQDPGPRLPRPGRYEDGRPPWARPDEGPAREPAPIQTRVVRITAEQARKLIRVLLVEGAQLGKADRFGSREVEDAPVVLEAGLRSNRPLCFEAGLAWGPSLLTRLAKYRAVLDGEPAKALGELIGGLQDPDRVASRDPQEPLPPVEPTPPEPEPAPAPQPAPGPRIPLFKPGQVELATRIVGQWVPERDGRMLAISPNGRRVAYAAFTEETSGPSRVACLAGPWPKNSPDAPPPLPRAASRPTSRPAIPAGVRTYATIDDVRFSPDSRRLAFAASRTKGLGVALVVDGREGKLYAAISPVLFSPDSRRVAYVASLGRATAAVVLDGVEGPAYQAVVGREPYGEECSPYRFDGDLRWADANARPAMAFSPDSRHFAYAAYTPDSKSDYENPPTCALVVDGKEVARCNGVWRILWSPDSSRMACVVGDGRQQCVLVDGKKDKLYEKIHDGALGFSPDSKRLVYVVEDRPHVGGILVENGREISELNVNADTVGFTADGKLTFVGTRRNAGAPVQRMEPEYVAVVDGSEVPIAEYRARYGFVDANGRVVQIPDAGPLPTTRAVQVGGGGRLAYANLLVQHFCRSADGDHFAFVNAKDPYDSSKTTLVVDGVELPYRLSGQFRQLCFERPDLLVGVTTGHGDRFRMEPTDDLRLLELQIVPRASAPRPPEVALAAVADPTLAATVEQIGRLAQRAEAAGHDASAKWLREQISQTYARAGYGEHAVAALGPAPPPRDALPLLVAAVAANAQAGNADAAAKAARAAAEAAQRIENLAEPENAYMLTIAAAACARTGQSAELSALCRLAQYRDLQLMSRFYDTVARTQIEAGDLTGAMVSVPKIPLGETRVPVVLLIARAMEAGGNRDGAGTVYLACLQLELEIARQSRRSTLAGATIGGLARCGRLEEAVRIALEAAGKDKALLGHARVLIDAQASSGDYAGAAKAATRIGQRLLAGEWQLLAGQKAEALESFRTVLAALPPVEFPISRDDGTRISSRAELLMRIAEDLATVGEPQEAEAALRRAKALCEATGSGGKPAEEAAWRARIGDLNGALALESRPMQQYTCRLLYAAAMSRRGDRKAAEEAIEKAVELVGSLDAKQRVYARNAVELRLKLGDPAGALEMARRIEGLEWWTLRAAVQANADAGRIEAAVDAALTYKEDAPDAELLAACIQHGDMAAARRYLDKFSGRFPIFRRRQVEYEPSGLSPTGWVLLDAAKSGEIDWAMKHVEPDAESLRCMFSFCRTPAQQETLRAAARDALDAAANAPLDLLRQFSVLETLACCGDQENALRCAQSLWSVVVEEMGDRMNKGFPTRFLDGAASSRPAIAMPPEARKRLAYEMLTGRSAEVVPALAALLTRCGKPELAEQFALAADREYERSRIYEVIVRSLLEPAAGPAADRLLAEERQRLPGYRRPRMPGGDDPYADPFERSGLGSGSRQIESPPYIPPPDSPMSRAEAALGRIAQAVRDYKRTHDWELPPSLNDLAGVPADLLVSQGEPGRKLTWTGEAMSCSPQDALLLIDPAEYEGCFRLAVDADGRLLRYATDEWERVLERHAVAWHRLQQDIKAYKPAARFSPVSDTPKDPRDRRRVAYGDRPVFVDRWIIRPDDPELVKASKNMANFAADLCAYAMIRYGRFPASIDALKEAGCVHDPADLHVPGDASKPYTYVPGAEYKASYGEAKVVAYDPTKYKLPMEGGWSGPETRRLHVDSDGYVCERPSIPGVPE